MGPHGSTLNIFFAFTKRLLNAFFAFSKHGSVFVSSFFNVKMARLLNVHFAFSVLPGGRVFVRQPKEEWKGTASGEKGY